MLNNLSLVKNSCGILVCLRNFKTCEFTQIMGTQDCGIEQIAELNLFAEFLLF